MTVFYVIFVPLKKRKEILEVKNNKEYAYINIGFHNWKKALKSFEDHQSSSCHKTAMDYHFVVPQCGDVMAMTNDHLVKSRAEERVLTEVKGMCSISRSARLAFQGDCTNKNDNFTQLMLLRGKDYLNIVERLSDKRNNKKKYIHADYQNELRNIMASRSSSNKT